MYSFLTKTFGGLTTSYYVRQFLFSLIFSIGLVVLAVSAHKGYAEILSAILFSAINSFLYPYSRFVYESIVDYLFGDNVIVTGLGFMIVVKALTMSQCWLFAIFVAPVGLAYLFWRNSRSTAN